MHSSGKVLITVHDGPVLRVWRDGASIACIPMTGPQAVGLVSDILAQVDLQGHA